MAIIKEKIHRIDLLTKLRKEFHHHNIQGYIIPSTDEYQSEYVPEYAKRLEYITGFSGSNGIALITLDQLILFTDGRYLTQAAYQLNEIGFQIFDIQDIKNFAWREYFSEDIILGYDFALFHERSISYFKNFKLKSIERNLIDKIWNCQPAKSNTEIWYYPIEFTGEDAINKIKRLFKSLKRNQLDYALITDSTSICWLLNLRAHDVEFTPLMLSYCLIECKTHTVNIFTNLNRPNLEVIIKLLPSNVKIHSESTINKKLNGCYGRISVSNDCPLKFLSQLKNCVVLKNDYDPCYFMKSIKNAVEITGAQKAHIYDAVALCEFFAWLHDIINDSSGDNNNNHQLSEYDLAIKLEYFRKIQPNYISDSFQAICGFSDNSAVIHYQPQQILAKKILGSGILLIDSGAHYLGGSTDVTRTISIGKAKKEQKIRYTQILKGHIAIASIIFPYGTIASNLDVLARQFLWKNGLNYPHSTGHGVGNVLSIHEGPQLIGRNNNVVLEPGMIISNEPGYYKPGDYGIRIENLLLVEKSSSYADFLQFKNLTLFPYHADLIIITMLTEEEREFLRGYYIQITKQIRPLLSEKAKYWYDNIFKSF